ncbi:MAG: pyridoxamine 5'-phosphate oxidase [Thermoanaerobaculia bacterium]
MAESLDPIAEFQALFTRISQDAPTDPTAVALATADASGAPSARMVLLKGVDSRGFMFFTNYDSRKGHDLSENPRAALCWYWAWLELQVRAEGEIERLSAAESDAYFATRPRGSQLGAWASFQSQPLDSRFALLRRVLATEARYFGRDIPRPPHWGGYLLRPHAIEFWQGKKSRLHERRRFELDGGTWRCDRLSP